MLTLRRHHHSSIPNGCSGTALPGDPHQDQGPPRHGAALYLWKGNDVAPSPHQATNHQQAVLAEFTGRLKGWRASNPNLILHLSWVIRGVHGHSIPCKLSWHHPRHPGDSLGVHNGTLHPQGPVVLPGLSWSWRGSGILSMQSLKETHGFLSSQSPLQSLQKDAAPSVQIIRSPKGNWLFPDYCQSQHESLTPLKLVRRPNTSPGSCGPWGSHDWPWFPWAVEVWDTLDILGWMSRGPLSQPKASSSAYRNLNHTPEERSWGCVYLRQTYTHTEREIYTQINTHGTRTQPSIWPLHSQGPAELNGVEDKPQLRTTFQRGSSHHLQHWTHAGQSNLSFSFPLLWNPSVSFSLIWICYYGHLVH